MDIEEKQAELIDYFTKRATALSPGPHLENLVLEATSHPLLFAFSEILSVPNIAELEGTQYDTPLNLLRLFAYGTWSDYKRNAGCLPALLPDQVRKLKQLSVLTLAETNKILTYDQFMRELDLSNVRELEDFLINECMYLGNEAKGWFKDATLSILASMHTIKITQGIVRGKLDQLRRCFEVQFAAGRDLRPEQLNSMINTLTNWLGTSDNLLHTIQEKIKWADTMSEADKKHRKEIEDKVEDVKKSLNADLDLRGHEEIIFAEPGGVMDFEEDRVRSKRRRQPMS